MARSLNPGAPLSITLLPWFRPPRRCRSARCTAPPSRPPHSSAAASYPRPAYIFESKYFKFSGKKPKLGSIEFLNPHLLISSSSLSRAGMSTCMPKSRESGLASTAAVFVVGEDSLKTEDFSDLVNNYCKCVQ